jgi:hypothetical protein
MFAQACGADVNADPLRGGFDAADSAGTMLATAVTAALSNRHSIPSLEFELKHVVNKLPLQPLPSNEECQSTLRDAQERLSRSCGQTVFSDEQLWDLQDELGSAESQAKSSKKDDVQPMEGQPWWLMDNVLCLTDLLKKTDEHDDRNLRFETQLFRIGDHWSLLSATHELFSQYQLWFDKNAPTQHNMVLAYTNACESYVPTDQDFSLGGYEAATFPSLAGAAFKYHHRRALRPGIEQMVIDQIRSMWM